MKEMNNTDTNTQSVPNTPKSNIFKYLFFILTFTVIILGIFYFFSINQNNKNSAIDQKDLSSQIQQEDNTSTVTWSKPVSSDQIIPIVKENTLYLYSLNNKTLQPTQYKTRWGSGYSDFGEDSPLVSPDGKLIAFINIEDDDSLYLISDQSQKALKITDYPVEYLNSWSSDGSKILFYTNVDNLVSRKDSQSEMGGGTYPTWEISETFIKDSAPGFHSFNINDGIDTYLPQLLNADQFIDSNRIIAEVTQPENNEKRFVLFNVDTFTADYATVNYPNKSFGLQKSFSADGNYWVINKDNGNTDSGTEMIYAKFPSQEGDLIDSAPWAFIQKPYLSPNNQYVAYQKRGEEIESGVYSYKTIIWDISSKKVIEKLDGSPRYWINKNTLLIGVGQYNSSNPSGYSSFATFNIDTQEKISIN